MTNRIAITGASGFVGRQLVPLFKAKGIELVLIGRDREKLSVLFPAHQVHDYSELGDAFNGVTAVLHLAVLNNDSDASTKEFERVNVGLLEDVVTAAKSAHVERLIYTATTHAHDKSSTYGRSKARAEEVLKDADGIDTTILRLPIVYGKQFGGKLSALNKLPQFAVSVLFSMLASLKPTLSVEALVNEIADALDGQGDFENLITDKQRGNWFYGSMRVALDVGFAISVLVLLWWLLLGVWVAVRVTSKGPGIFAQTRIGKSGKPFTLYKFRTMAPGTPQAGTHEITAAALTSVGGFLRKSKIDELPQIWNILRGEISLIGPRPCLPSQNELIDARTSRAVFDIKPGITGLAQVRGIDMSDPQLLARVDEEYLKLRALPLDLKILLRTFVGRGSGDRVKPELRP